MKKSPPAPSFSPVYLLLFFLPLYLAPGCSSVPKKPETVTEIKNKAADYAKFGDLYFNQAQYEQAHNFYNMALRENISVDNEEGILKTYNAIGKVYLAEGKIDQAVNAFIQAYTLAQKLNNNLLLSQCENNIGQVYLIQGDSKAALTIFNKALDRQVKDSDNNSAILYHNTGLAYKHQNDFAKALEYLNKALILNEKNKNYLDLASNYYTIASVYSVQGDYTSALQYARLALENDKREENSVGIAKDLLALGLINLKGGKTEDSYEYLKKSFLVYKSLDLIQEMKKLLTYLEQTARLLKLDKEADSYRETYNNLEQ
ncbi:MAG: tetratricopeptide repeat protein [Spirochaetota bacterium]